MIQDLEKIEISLIKLKRDFNIQLSALSSDSKEFHNSIIELSYKYPNHKELLQFIVHVNDKLEAHQSLFSDIVADTFNDMLEVKADMVGKMIQIQKKAIKDKEKSDSFFKRVKSNIINAHLKTIIGYIVAAVIVIALVIGAITNPKGTVEVFDSVGSVFSNKTAKILNTGGK